MQIETEKLRTRVFDLEKMNADLTSQREILDRELRQQE